MHARPRWKIAVISSYVSEINLPNFLKRHSFYSVRIFANACERKYLVDYKRKIITRVIVCFNQSNWWIWYHKASSQVLPCKNVIPAWIVILFRLTWEDIFFVKSGAKRMATHGARKRQFIPYTNNHSQRGQNSRWYIKKEYKFNVFRSFLLTVYK